MKIFSQCSHCNEKYELDSKLLGRKAKCKNCSEEFIIAEISSVEEKTENKIVKNTESQIVKKAPDMTMKPHKNSFLFLNAGFITLLIVWLLALLIHIFAGIVFLILAAAVYGLNIVVYNKTFYTITDRKLIYKTGSIISDNTVEVNLDKITLATARLWFIQNKIFKTGNLFVKTAGSSSSKIKFIHIENTLDIYEGLQSRMKKNGFSLQKDKLVHIAKPHVLGVFGEIWTKIATFWILAVYIFVWTLASIKDFSDKINIWFIISLYVLIVVIILIFSYLDLKRRKYEVFTDSIFYSEGFLTKNYSFIPMENISDTENQQSFLSKIFGIHDVIISSQGASNKVLFKNMVGGQEMMESIKYLKDKTIMGTKDIINGDVKTESLIGFKDKIEFPLDYNKEFKGEYKMNVLKSMASVIFIVLLLSPLLFIGSEALFVIIIILIPAIIKIGIAIFSTKFIVTESSIEYKYDFFSHKHNSFSVEKITKVTVIESLLDKLFWTCSVKFYSIWSWSPIVFKNIKKTEDICNKLLSKVGIYLVEDKKSIFTHFNLLEFIKAYVFSTIFIIVTILWTLVIWNFEPLFFTVSWVMLIWWILIFVYLSFFYSKKFYKNNLYKNFIESKKWILIQTINFALFRHIKSTHSTKNIATTVGNISLNVAGEQVTETKGWSNVNFTQIFASNSINIKYAKSSHGVVNMFDSIYLEKDLDDTEVLSSKPAIWNSIIWLLILAILVIIGTIILVYMITSTIFRSELAIALSIILLIFLPLMGIIIWNVKVKRFSFQKDRVVYSSGIFYKKILSIPYIRFNFIENNTWFINKIFKNGNVWIFTIWSGKKEMNIWNISNYIDVYNLLNKD